MMGGSIIGDIKFDLTPWLRQGQNSFRMTSLILLLTTNLLGEVEHFFAVLFALGMCPR